MSHKRKSALETLNQPQAKCPRVEYQVPSETEQWIDGKTSGETKCKTNFTCDRNRVLAQRIASHRKEIVQHAKIGKLRPYLNQKKLLSPEENRYLQSDAFSNSQKVSRVLDSLKEKQNGFTTFLACVKDERSHLGHLYITSLLEGTQFASEPELRLSALCKQRIDENLPRLIRGVNLSSLMPHLQQSFYLPCCGVQAQLLTNDDAKKLWNVKGTNKRIRQLFLILETKGPLAHHQFAACMQAENEHTTHHELFRDIFGNLNFLEMDGVVLEGNCYDKLMEKFYSLHHNSDGHQQLVTEAEEAMAQDLPLELQALYRIELARSFIFRTQNERAEEPLSAALEICGKISDKNANLVPEARNKNAFIIYGRCHYTLADLYRFKNDYERAKEHSGKALDALDDVKPGLDTANAHYVNGCILLERHIAKPSIPLDIQVIERFFNSAISDGEDSDVARQVTTPQSYCRLAQLYMISAVGTICSAIGVTSNEDNLKKARQSLDACKWCDLDIISQRSRYLYFVVESDWYTINGDTEKADDAALKAHQIAEKTSYALEILTLKTRSL